MTDRWGWQPFAWEQNDLRTWRFAEVPAGSVTRRQMRAVRLAPGGAQLVGQVVFTHRRRLGVEVRALLWDRQELVAKRVASSAQMVALSRALAARRWCPGCCRDVGYCVPTSLGRCVDCAFPETTGGCEEASHVG
ncbi:MAG TPA: RRQRL motif-containing zinc-binding protein [Pseudonocardia sp.]|jgi:hypothetical protein